MKCLLVLFSYHHHNTEKIAKVIADVFGAEIKIPQHVHPDDLQGYDLIGFGSGIYSGKHHPSLLSLADKIPRVSTGNAFIFSTCGIPAIGLNETIKGKNHALLREKLQSRGYVIVGEFSCVGFNTNSFLKLFGGINKGRPNAEDFRHAAEFADDLKQKLEKSPREH